MFLCEHRFSLPWGNTQKSNFQIIRYMHIYFIRKLSYCFAEWLYHFLFLPVILEISSFLSHVTTSIWYYHYFFFLVVLMVYRDISLWSDCTFIHYVPINKLQLSAQSQHSPVQMHFIFISLYFCLLSPTQAFFPQRHIILPKQ